MTTSKLNACLWSWARACHALRRRPPRPLRDHFLWTFTVAGLILIGVSLLI